MKSYFVKTPAFIKRLFYTQIWSVPNNNKVVYLTFDDGPIPEVTPWVISLLNKHNIKATFFCIGDNISKYPEVFNLLIENKHQIANHTFNHVNGWKTSFKTYIDNVMQCNLVLPTTTKLFRPPYGKITRKQSTYLIKQDFKIIMWDVLSADFDQNITPEKCLDNVIKNVTSGSIIVFHDSLKARKNLEYALPKTIDYLLSNGYEFKTL